MLDQKWVNEDLLIVAPFDMHTSFLNFKKANPHFNFKLMSKEELLFNVFFSYSDKATFYLYKKGYSFENAKELLSNLYFLKGDSSSKIKLLNQIKEELLKNNLLKTNPLFKKYVAKRKVLVAHYSELDSEIQSALNSIGANYQYLDLKETEGFFPQVIKYHTLEDEVIGFFTNVNELLKKGVSLNSIKLVSPTSEYQLYLEKYAALYGIKISKLNKESIYFSSEFKKLVELSKTIGIKEAFKSEEIDLSSSVIQKVLDSFLEVSDIPLSIDEEQAYLSYLGKKETLEEQSFNQSIEIVTLNKLNNNDYFCILGFEQGKYPHVYQDDQFLFDTELEYLGRLTSFIKNQIEEKELIKRLTQTKNLFISFKEIHFKDEFYPSELIAKLGLKVIAPKEKIFSSEASLIFLGKQFDNYYHYHLNSPYLSISLKDEIKYKSYDHQFKSFDLNLQDVARNYSYSGVDLFYGCSFAYYLNYFLKVGAFEGNFNTELGAFVHYLLENLDNIDDDLEKYLDAFNFSFKERIWVINLFPQIKKALQVNRSFLKETKLKSFSNEVELTYQISPLVKVNGRVDRLNYDEGSKKAMIVDYKTSDYVFDPKQIEYGFHLQLPIYALLLEQHYQDYSIVGLYINQILNDPTGTTYQEDDLKYLLYRGITSDEEEDLLALEPNFPEFKYIGKIKKSKDGGFTNLYSKEHLQEMIQIAKDLIIKMDQEIRQNKFSINPKEIKGVTKCRFCPFSDICFKDEKDVVQIDLNAEVEQ